MRSKYYSPSTTTPKSENRGARSKYSIAVTVSEKEKETIKAEAKRIGISASALLRTSFFKINSFFEKNS